MNAELHGCFGKMPFASATLALKIARRDRRRKGRMNAYRCRFCGHWHLGHKTPSNMNGKRRS